jgi:multiple sugar transport system substrate-binding protein
MLPRTVSRREFLKRSATIGAGLAAFQVLAACAPATAPQPAAPVMPAEAGATEFDWRRYQGEKIEVTFTLGNLVDVLFEHQDEFEELTGIAVGAEQIPEQQARQKQVIEFNSGATSFDVCHYSYHVHKRLFAKNHWTLDLREYLDDPTMTPEDFDWDDFSPGAKAYATDTEGRICSIPIKVDLWMMYWNKALFEANGVEFPDNYEECWQRPRACTTPTTT